VSRAVRRLLPAALLLAAIAGSEVLERAKRGPPPPEPEWTDFDYFYSDIYDDVFRLTVNDWTPVYKTDRPRASPQSFAARKPADSYRVFVVGGSVAVRFADENVARLREFFSRALPGKSVELIACGMAGYDSFRDSLVLKDVLRHRPDAIVVLSGNNEYYTPETYSPSAYRMTRALRRFWIFRLTLDRFRPSRPPEQPPMKTRLASFEANLRLMARLARNKGVPLIFCTLPANIRDTPPLRSKPPLETPGYLDAWAAFDAGDDALASERLKRFIRAHPTEPFSRYWLAKSLDRRGLHEAAREQYLGALEYDDPGERCAPARNEIIRRVARETGMITADLDRTFDGIAENGTPDGRLFNDGMHWRKEYYPLASWTIVRAAYDAARAGGASYWDGGWLEAEKRAIVKPAVSRDSLAETGDVAVYKAMTYAIQAKGDLSEGALAMFADESRHDPARFEFLTRSFENVRPVFESNMWLKSSEKELIARWDDVLVHRGETYRRRKDYAAALRAFDEVLAHDPRRDRALLLRALTLHALGRADAARESLARISAESARLPEFASGRSRVESN
jgi:tetratricopeptide (TPR) repeat protein